MTKHLLWRPQKELLNLSEDIPTREQELRLGLVSQTGKASEAKTTRIAAAAATADGKAIAFKESARVAEPV